MTSSGVFSPSDEPGIDLAILGKTLKLLLHARGKLDLNVVESEMVIQIIENGAEFMDELRTALVSERVNVAILKREFDETGSPPHPGNRVAHRPEDDGVRCAACRRLWPCGAPLEVG